MWRSVPSPLRPSRRLSRASTIGFASTRMRTQSSRVRRRSRGFRARWSAGSRGSAAERTTRTTLRRRRRSGACTSESACPSATCSQRWRSFGWRCSRSPTAKWARRRNECARRWSRCSTWSLPSCWRATASTSLRAFNASSAWRKRSWVAHSPERSIGTRTPWSWHT